MLTRRQHAPREDSPKLTEAYALHSKMINHYERKETSMTYLVDSVERHDERPTSQMMLKMNKLEMEEKI
jgi:hypothetical protein